MISPGVSGLLLIILVVGCSTVKVEPALEWPEKPAVQWTCDLTRCSLPLKDANELNRWFLKLQAYKDARDRILGR